MLKDEKSNSCNWWCWICWFKFNKITFKKNKKIIISLDNYSSGSYKNHLNDKRVKYIRGNTFEIEKKLIIYKKKFTQFFILESLQEFIKVLKNLMSAINQIQLVLMQYLNFV